VYHVGGATYSKEIKKTFLNFSLLIDVDKNLPENKLYPILLGRMVLDGIAGMQFLVTGKFKHFVAILKAHFRFTNFFSSL
jgi:hypothetical protein